MTAQSQNSPQFMHLTMSSVVRIGWWHDSGCRISCVSNIWAFYWTLNNQLTGWLTDVRYAMCTGICYSTAVHCGWWHDRWLVSNHAAVPLEYSCPRTPVRIEHILLSYTWEVSFPSQLVGCMCFLWLLLSALRHMHVYHSAQFLPNQG